MRVGALIRSYHATKFLDQVLKQYSWVDKICLMNYRFNTVSPIEDNTEEIARNSGLKNIIFDKGEGLEQHEILNRGMWILADCDVVFISDADEFINHNDFNKILQQLDQQPEKKVVYCQIVDYAKNIWNKMKPRTNCLVAVKPGVKFNIIRCIQAQPAIHMNDIAVHHLGFVFPEETMKWKYKWEAKEEKIKEESFNNIFENTIPVTPPDWLCEIAEKSNGK